MEFYLNLENKFLTDMNYNAKHFRWWCILETCLVSLRTFNKKLEISNQAVNLKESDIWIKDDDSRRVQNKSENYCST